MKEIRPGVFVTYNGDFFDWPFIEARAQKQGWSIHDELSFRIDTSSGEAWALARHSKSPQEALLCARTVCWMPARAPARLLDAARARRFGHGRRCTLMRCAG